jgi:acetyl-CoA acetyltransferase
MVHPLRDRAAIVGVGYTEFSKNSGVSTLTLALRAISAACADAGIAVSDLDGAACHRVGDSVQGAVVVQALGMRDPHFYVDQFGGGSASHTVVSQAALAVAAGVADYVVCWRAINARSEWRMGGTGRPPPDVVEFQYQTPYGYATPPQQFAVQAQQYLHKYGATREDFGRVAIIQRDNASRSPRAMMRAPITMDDYLESRMIVEPLCLFDCCLETDAAIAVVVTSAERARNLRHRPVLISGAVWGGGQTLFSNHRDDFTTTAAVDASARLYEMAGVGPSDIDVACIYDAFTPLVLVQLEDYGFCGKGEAPGFMRDGNTVKGGSLPVNPHGGHLSEGYVHGLNHIAEAVQQLRGDADERQVPGAEVALSTGQPGLVAGTMSALILRRGDS